MNSAVIKISHIDMGVGSGKSYNKEMDDTNNSDVQFSVSTPVPRDKYKHSDVMKYEVVQLSYL